MRCMCMFRVKFKSIFKQQAEQAIFIEFQPYFSLQNMKKLADFHKLTFFIHLSALRKFIYFKICMLTLCLM
jgi:hypothetical protein